jgi:hypothetical protein
MTIKILFLAAVLALAGCASYTGSDQGRVGTREVIDGVDFWKGGPPPRPYQVITNVNWEGADSSTSYRQEEETIAGQARRQGADAVIVVDEVMTASRLDAVGGRPIMAPKVATQLIRYR